MRVLIVGGAGYIGSFVYRMMRDRGYDVHVLDNLTTGHRQSLPDDASFVFGDLENLSFLKTLFEENRYDAVMHFSAKSLVGESVRFPLDYYRNNVSNTTNLLSAMTEAGVRLFVFSSTSAIFGAPDIIPITEDCPPKPINPYGASKAMIERILEDTGSAHDFRYVALRYFNAAGGAPDGSIGEDHTTETHIIPLLLRTVLRKKDPFRIFGADYDTPDGTCIRDYIHVDDLAEAHILALEYLKSGGESRAYNLGNGCGFSVRETVRTAIDVVGKDIPVVEAPRRPGDPPVLIASSERIQKELGWTPRYPSLKDIIETAWRWHSTHPDGYR